MYSSEVTQEVVWTADGSQGQSDERARRDGRLLAWQSRKNVTAVLSAVDNGTIAS